MADRLTPLEREDLAPAMAAIRAAGPALEPDRHTARQFVDVVRSNLAGADEVTFGRAFLMAAAVVARLQEEGHDPRTVGNVLVIAAIDLTALEDSSTSEEG